MLSGTASLLRTCDVRSAAWEIGLSSRQLRRLCLDAFGYPPKMLWYFLSESTWDSEKINDRGPELLLSDPATAPHTGGALVGDDSGDRKDGTETADVGRQWLGRYGKTDNGIVTVTTMWADERVYYPLHAQPCTPGRISSRAATIPTATFVPSRGSPRIW